MFRSDARGQVPGGLSSRREPRPDRVPAVKLGSTGIRLELDCEAEAERIAAFIRQSVGRVLGRRGVVVAVSGGIDSSTTAALCVRALGRERVFALLLPERDSSPESTHYGRMLVDHLGIQSEVVDISPILEAMGCYRRRDAAIHAVIADYTPACLSKIVLRTTPGGMSFFSVVIETPEGVRRQARLSTKSYLELVAATNMKQRSRKALEYYHADRLNFAVAGTPNFLEYDQGFFVKLGDGAADLKPIAHLYKTQVYAMARHLGLPQALCERQPTTDTYSLEQTQEEFYFQLPYTQMDIVAFGLDHRLDVAEVADWAGLPVGQVQAFQTGIERKRRATAPLHFPPLTLLPARNVPGSPADDSSH